MCIYSHKPVVHCDRYGQCAAPDGTALLESALERFLSLRNRLTEFPGLLAALPDELVWIIKRCCKNRKHY